MNELQQGTHSHNDVVHWLCFTMRIGALVNSLGLRVKAGSSIEKVVFQGILSLGPPGFPRTLP